MTIEVELFGIPRARTGTHRISVLSGRSSAQLSEVLAALGKKFPDFAAACLDQDRLRAGFIASVDGEFFTQGDVTVQSGKSVLILSADAGG